MGKLLASAFAGILSMFVISYASDYRLPSFDEYVKNKAGTIRECENAEKIKMLIKKNPKEYGNQKVYNMLKKYKMKCFSKKKELFKEYKSYLAKKRAKNLESYKKGLEKEYEEKMKARRKHYIKQGKKSQEELNTSSKAKNHKEN